MRATLSSLLFVAFTTCLFASPTAPSDNPAPYFWLAPYSPSVPSLKAFAFEHYLTVNTHYKYTVHSAEWEIRDATSNHLLARFPAIVSFFGDIPDARPDGHKNETQVAFEPEQIQAMGNPRSGTFLMAFIVNGVRVSNVIRFKVDPTLDLSKEPTLRLGMIEAPPGQDCGELVAWVVGPTPQDPELTNAEVAFADIFVDGKLYHEDNRIMAMPDGPYPPGEPNLRTFNSNRLKGVSLAKSHDFRLQVGKYTSDTVSLNLKSHPLADQWDKATTRSSVQH